MKRPNYEPKTIDNTLLREYFEKRVQEGESWSQLALRCKRKKGGSKYVSGDTTWLKRKVGLSLNQKANRPAKRIHYKTAENIIKNLDLDPKDFGI